MSGSGTDWGPVLTGADYNANRMKRRRAAPDSASLLSPDELRRAAETPVWILWWEDPERSWEAICLSESEAGKEFAARESDALLQSWGKAGKHDRQTLLEWFEGHLRVVHPSSADGSTAALREVLRKHAAGEAEPVTLRTW